MPRGRWKRTPTSLAEEAFCVLIRGEKPGRGMLAKRELKKVLAEQRIALKFLSLCVEHDDSVRLTSFRKGLQFVVQAVGTTAVAKATKIHRVTLYRMLDKGGNPSLENMNQVLKALGLRISVKIEENPFQRQKVVRPKDVKPGFLPKVSSGRRIWTRNNWDDDEREDW